MIEARVFVDDIEKVREILTAHKAEPKGKYRIHDTIYRCTDKSIPLIDEFLRIRHIPDNIWDEKAVILAIKRTHLQTIGKLSDIPTKVQFDDENDAYRYYEQNLKDAYEYDFDFWRIGWQYMLPGGDVVDLEIVESAFPTIEMKSETVEGIAALVKMFNIKESQLVSGPSVVAVRALVA